jgi:hypothetical protein
MILVGGLWVHSEGCAEHMAEAVTPAPEREPEPEPRPVPDWVYVVGLPVCILGLAVLPFGFVWTLPVLTVVAGFAFVLGLAWLDPPWTDARAARYCAGDV